MLDGNYWFPVAHSARYLLDFGNEIEQVIIVGIGYNWGSVQISVSFLSFITSGNEYNVLQSIPLAHVV